jgi:molybdopterin/thiamine biosynthesis adenylyltransferase
MDIDYSDQTAIFDPGAFNYPIHLVGMGGIGSAVFFPLLKLGVSEIHLWDFDDVEPHNIPCQLIYRPSDIGQPKVEAARDFAERQEVACEIVSHKERVTQDTRFDGIVISGVDSMSARQDIWQAVQGSRRYVPLLLDGRIGGEQLELYSVQLKNLEEMESYEAHRLFDDKEAAPLPCAARTVIHPPTVLAGLTVAQLTLFARNVSLTPAMLVHLKSMQFII